jgi:hypothetical protein
MHAIRRIRRQGKGTRERDEEVGCCVIIRIWQPTRKTPMEAIGDQALVVSSLAKAKIRYIL